MVSGGGWLVAEGVGWEGGLEGVVQVPAPLFEESMRAGDEVGQ